MEGKDHLDVGSQLRSALEKDASYDRLVFIEINVANSMIGEGADTLISNIVQVLDSRERLTVHGEPTPPAYVIVTNNPYSYHPDSPIDRWAGAHGYKIPDLKFRTQFAKRLLVSDSKLKTIWNDFGSQVSRLPSLA